MTKTVLKEIIIILLLCLAILLILSVLFYDYNPISKVVPNKIAYNTPENIKEELQAEESVEEITIENKVYTIEGSDLNIYKKSNSYTPGKANPFATVVEDENTTNVENGQAMQNETTKKEETPTNTNQESNNDKGNQNKETFWNETGRK